MDEFHREHCDRVAGSMSTICLLHTCIFGSPWFVSLLRGICFVITSILDCAWARLLPMRTNELQPPLLLTFCWLPKLQKGKHVPIQSESDDHKDVEKTTLIAKALESIPAELLEEMTQLVKVSWQKCCLWLSSNSQVPLFSFCCEETVLALGQNQ